jgi:hypothetical protein
VAWVLAVLALALLLGVAREVAIPTLVEQSAAGALGVVLAIGLATRSGADVRLYAVVSVALVTAAVVTQWPDLLGGAATATAVVAACLAVLGTRPATTFLRAVGEVVLALALATAGGLAVAGFSVDLDPDRIRYSVLPVATAATIALVYRLGGGLHGLGPRGLVLASGAAVLLVVVVVYTAALTRYGSPELVDPARSGRAWVQDHLGGAPLPVEVLVGIPALAWGVSMRSRRRQGWWVCAFGAAATATAATRLVVSGEAATSTLLSAAYSLVLGLLVGLVLIRLEQLITRSPESRTTRAEQAATLRTEPPRMQPLH